MNCGSFHSGPAGAGGSGAPVQVAGACWQLATLSAVAVVSDARVSRAKVVRVEHLLS